MKDIDTLVKYAILLKNQNLNLFDSTEIDVLINKLNNISTDLASKKVVIGAMNLYASDNDISKELEESINNVVNYFIHLEEGFKDLKKFY